MKCPRCGGFMRKVCKSPVSAYVCFRCREVFVADVFDGGLRRVRYQVDGKRT